MITDADGVILEPSRVSVFKHTHKGELREMRIEYYNDGLVTVRITKVKIAFRKGALDKLVSGAHSALRIQTQEN